jgi:hypothetical protein
VKALALSLLVAGSAFAEGYDETVFPAPADAPYRLKTGQPAPADGLLLPDEMAIAAARRLKACEAEQPVLKKGVEASAPWWVVPVVLVVALGAGIGVGFGVK